MGSVVCADFMAFPFSQLNLMRHADCVLDCEFDLDFAHITVAPPFVQTTLEILRERDWFNSVLKNQTCRTEFFYGIQHPPLDATYLNIRALVDSGILFCTIAYKDQNLYGGGFAAGEYIGLSKTGEQLLRWMTDCDMVLDLSHANLQTASDALNCIARFKLPLKVVATHTGVFDQYGHLRNFPLFLLKRIVDAGGIIGIPLITFLLDSEDDSYLPCLRHLRVAIDYLGEDSVCIGSDAIYQTVSDGDAFTLHKIMCAEIDPTGDFSARLLNKPPEFNTALKMQAVANVMMNNGFSNRVIQKVVGENLAGFFTLLRN